MESLFDLLSFKSSLCSLTKKRHFGPQSRHLSTQTGTSKRKKHQSIKVWSAPRDSHLKASHPQFPHFPRLRCPHSPNFPLFPRARAADFLRPLVGEETLPHFPHLPRFARGGGNCKMRKILPTGLILTGFRCSSKLAPQRPNRHSAETLHYWTRAV